MSTTRSKKSTAIAVLFCLLLLAVVLWFRPSEPSSSSSTSSSSDGGAARDEKILATLPQGWSRQGALWQYQGKTMGTTLAVSIRGAKADSLETLSAKIQARLAAVNAAMSTYQKGSEISVFNSLTPGHSLTLSSEFATVVGFALQVAERSEGAFDPTVGPLVRAWGFGAKAKSRKDAPAGNELQALLARVGYKKLKFNPKTRWLTRGGPLELDLSAVAKGYGVDVVQALLIEQGYANHMVEIGGEVCVSGKPDSSRAWKIGIEAPSQGASSAREVLKVLQLDAGCLATSGDYRSYLELDGQKRQHTIDPRTGESVRNGVASVSVLAKSAMQADAWATAMMVMGSDKALALAKAEGMEIMVILRDGPDLKLNKTPGFAQRLVP